MMLAERRTRAVRDLNAVLGDATEQAQLAAQTVRVLADFELDLPFLLFYEFDGDAAAYVLRGRGEWDPPTRPLDEDGQGVPYASYGFAAQVASVEVDPELGTVRVLKV